MLGSSLSQRPLEFSSLFLMMLKSIRTIGDLNLVVGLWVSRGREMIFDLKCYIEFLEPGIVELFVVVGDEHSGDPKPTHN